MKSKIVGIVLLVIIIGAGIAYQQFFRGGPVVTLKGYVGGEKIALLENPEVQEILHKKYGIKLDAIKAGSIEMVREAPAADVDFLWPSSQVALELYKMNNHPLVKSEVVFNSPIVLYSWAIVTDALMQQGIVEQIDDVYYIVKFPELIRLVVEGKSWKDIGVDQLYGRVAINSTDPTKSNSGNMFAGLLANLLYEGGDVVDETTLATVLPTVKMVFTQLGFMEHSSHDLFSAYLNKGVGDKPIIVGYENQIVELSIEYASIWDQAKENVRILYPRPTAWSSHPLIILHDSADDIITAFQDEEIRAIAWEQHGFRTGLMGVQNDPAVLDILGIPADITHVIPMPSPQVMERIIQALQIP